MLLAGMAFSFIAGSITASLEFVADNHKLKQISLWQMGGVDGANAGQAWLLLVVLLVLWQVVSRAAGDLDALLLGESEARHLGVDVRRLKRRMIVVMAAAVATAVALTGTIAFVGLLVPHMARLLVGPGYRRLLP